MTDKQQIKRLREALRGAIETMQVTVKRMELFQHSHLELDDTIERCNNALAETATPAKVRS